MKKEITLAAREKILKLQDFLIDNADGKNIEGTGKEILHTGNSVSKNMSNSLSFLRLPNTLILPGLPFP